MPEEENAKMLHRASPMQDGSRMPAKRRDDLGPKAALFAEVDEELHDIKRVHMQGQEEDLRYALGRLISRVEELVRHSLQITLWTRPFSHEINLCCCFCHIRGGHM